MKKESGRDEESSPLPLPDRASPGREILKVRARQGAGRDGMFRLMDERQFCDEARTTKPAVLNCSWCKRQETYQLHWLVRTKKKRLSPKAGEEARAKFNKFQSYMLLLDDVVQCSHCRRRIEVSGIKTVAYL